MRLSPRELEGLLIHQTGFLAQKRLARGLKLNHPEAVALIACQVWALNILRKLTFQAKKEEVSERYFHARLSVIVRAVNHLLCVVLQDNRTRVN